MSTHDFDPTPQPGGAARRRWRRLCVLIASALLLHAVVLGGVNWTWPLSEPPPLPAATMQVRVVEPAPLRAATDEPVIADRMDAVVPALPMKPRAAVARARPVAPAIAVQAAEPVADVSSAAPPIRLALAAATPAASAPAEPADDEAIPHYRTRLPPAGTLRYEVSRGMLRGVADLLWQPQADRYELRFDFKLSGLTILSQASSGGFDAAGIAPLRFTDQRLRRTMTAANFQRDAGKITYSGSRHEYPLRAGAQDRLSWMMQLAGIVAAEPQLAKPGGKVVMSVTGANGDAGVWVFRCIGPEPVEARGGTVEAVKFVREPREANDTAVQVWLDPKQHDLPVRATQKSGPSDEGYELRLLEVMAPK